jgi:ABC-type multidrug transport system ATPase subunit
MTLCSHCHTSNPPNSNFCQHCGRALSVEIEADKTRMLSATLAGPRAPQQQHVELTQLFGDKTRLIIGRAPDCDIPLVHPTVSRYHARIERRPDGLYLLDLSSVNGIWLGGRRITEATRIHDRDRVGIGPYLLSISGGALHSLDNSRSLRLEARALEKIVALNDGGKRKLLDDVNLVVDPGEFVTLLGPSGSGKSTLMDCLNGRRPATGGRVLANGEDFYRHFDNFRQSLGYVPQRDIVHTGLSVYRALYYTAQLRLPPDTDPEELRARVEDVLGQMELIPHRDTLVANLSGGQIKRVSLGAELIAEPSILYIDEATSGLDAGTEARMMRLFRRVADEGRSIICITHNVDNVDQCHLVLVLARGKVIYYGPPGEAPAYFGVKRLGEIYDRIAERGLGEWEERFRNSDLHRTYVVGRLAQPAPPQDHATPAVPAPPAQAETSEPRGSFRGLSQLLADSRKLMARFPPLADRFRELEASWLRWREKLAVGGEIIHQFRVLTARYVELIWQDRRGLRLLLLQAPIVAVFLLMGFTFKPYSSTMPYPRPLTDEERRMLTALRALNQALAEDTPLNDQQKQTLARIQVRLPGLPVVTDGQGVLRVLRHLARDDLNDSQKQALREVRVQVRDEDGGTTEVNGLDMVQSYRKFLKSNIPDQLLRVQGSVVPEKEGPNPRFTYILLFIITMIVLWFGCNNAAKEIVKEEAIYGRERAVNLRILPYLASKFIVLTAITVFHAVVLMLLLYGTLEVLAAVFPRESVPPASLMLGYGGQFGVFVMLSMTSVALGLLLSACVSTPDRANALLPYVLIPQLILGGGILSVNKFPLHELAITLSPVYWAFRAIHLGADQLPPDFPLYRDYPDGVLLPCLALAAQALILLLATAWFMKRKDV